MYSLYKANIITEKQKLFLKKYILEENMLLVFYHKITKRDLKKKSFNLPAHIFLSLFIATHFFSIKYLFKGDSFK